MNIDNIIQRIPLALDKNDKTVQDLALFYLPYSTGFEIECPCIDDVDIDAFKNIPDIMEADVGNMSEQRFRIPNGIIGLQCLFNISITLKRQALLNPKSGIHYHVDCTDVYDNFTESYIKDKTPYILSELDKWNYTGTYNNRRVLLNGGAVWVRGQNVFKTLEFRIGEMTFDYTLLFKRIVHCNDIVRTLKNDLYKTPLERYEDDSELGKIVSNRIIKI